MGCPVCCILLCYNKRVPRLGPLNVWEKHFRLVQTQGFVVPKCGCVIYGQPPLPQMFLHLANGGNMSRCRAEILDDLQNDAATDFLLARLVFFHLEPATQERLLGVDHIQQTRAFMVCDPVPGGSAPRGGEQSSTGTRAGYEPGLVS